MKNKAVLIIAAVVVVALAVTLVYNFVIKPQAVMANVRVIQVAVDRFAADTGRSLDEEEGLAGYWVEENGVKMLKLNSAEVVQATQDALEGFIVEIPPHPLADGYYSDEHYYAITKAQENGKTVYKVIVEGS